MKTNVWKRAAAIGMTVGMLISGMPVSAYADEMLMEGDTYIVAEDDTEAVMAPEIDEIDEDIFDDDLFSDVDESEIEDELVLGIATEENEVELQAAASTTTGTCGDNLTWTLDGNGTLTISGTGRMEDYKANSTLPWASVWASVKTVIIENGVTAVGDYAFCGCFNLESVTTPDSVTSIGDYTFYNCTGLTSVMISDNLTGIGSYAFRGCTSLNSVPMPDSVTEIGEAAFSYCALTSVMIPAGVTNIGPRTFYRSSLTSVTIPDSVTSIDESAFSGCSGLTDIYYSGSKTDWAAIDGIEYEPLSSATIHYGKETRLEIEFEDGKDTYIYRGKAVIPDVVVRGYMKSWDGPEEEVDVVEGVDYTLTYKDNNIENPETDTVTATVTANGLGDFEGCTDEIEFTIKYNEICLDYLEVGVGGNVTVHWCFTGAVDSISGFEVQHCWKDSVDDPDGWRTTKVSGSDKREVDIVDLSYNTYEFRVRALSKDAEDGDSEWTDWAECPVKEIKLLSPEPGSQYGDSLGFAGAIDFGSTIKLAKGEDAIVSVYGNGGNPFVISNDDLSLDAGYTADFESRPDEVLIIQGVKAPSVREAENPGTNWFSPDTTYHVAISEKRIEYLQGDGGNSYDPQVYFKGIASSETTWTYKTEKLSYSCLVNPMGIEIPDDYYKALYFPEDWEDIKKKDNGTTGFCFGLCYLLGAYKNKYTMIKKITDGYDQLADVPIESSGLLEYIEKAQIALYKYSNQKAIKLNKNRLDNIYSGIKSGTDIVLCLKADNGAGHAIYPLGIVSDETGLKKIAVYDSNFSANINDLYFYTSAIGTLTMNGSLDSYEYQNLNANITYVPVTNYVDAVVGGNDPDVEALLLSGSVEFPAQDNLLEFQTFNGENTATGNNLYWLEDTAYHFNGADEPVTITLSDGTNKLYATLAGGQPATLDMERNSVTIDGAASDDAAGDYMIRFSEAEDYDTFHDMVIKGTSGNADTILTKTADGISVETNANTVISVSTEENDTETASVKVKLADGTAQIRVDEGGTINVYADLDGDGSYTDAVQPVDTELKETDAEQITISKKPSIKKPTAAKTNITVKWSHFKHTSKKMKPLWKKIKKVQVQCATDSGFTNIVKTATVGKSKTKAKIKGLSKNMNYYVRVRYYDGTGYSAWSKVKKIKTKK